MSNKSLSSNRRSFLPSSAAAGAAAMFATKADAASEDGLSALSTSTFQIPSLTIFAGASLPRAGRIRRPSMIHRRACSLRRLRSSRATGRPSTTGARCEARLNALPQFITEIDGLDIHFIHVRSKHENALPLIVTHGWPGSVIEQLKIIDPLTNPTAHGGSAADAFDVVIPSMPGYGFSGKPTATGWDPAHIARAWVVLMKRLGYTKFVAQGGDWGAVITELMGVQAPPELLGIHTNMPGVFPADIDKAAASGAPAPSGLSADEKVAYESCSSSTKGNRLRVPDGAASADALRDRRFAGRPGGLFPRSRRAQLRADRARL